MEEVIVSNLAILYRFEHFHSKKPDYMIISFFFSKKIKIIESLYVAVLACGLKY